MKAEGVTKISPVLADLPRRNKVKTGVAYAGKTSHKEFSLSSPNEERAGVKSQNK
jgi:hypothetical protein